MSVITHQPVLCAEALSALQIVPGGIYIDGTFGQGGHTAQILEKVGSKGRVVAIDRDPTSVAYVMDRFSRYSNLRFCYSSFARLRQIAIENDLLNQVNGILLDLGTSAMQLETPTRGFSFLRDGPLDMRMDPAQGETAQSWLATASTEEMASIFHRYGEERWAKRIARAITEYKKKQAITTTSQLANLIKEAHPRWPKKIHPATRIFQAIRIHINQEMHELVECLRQSMEVLAPGGRLAVITFHSLEAREVKKFIRHAVQKTDLEKNMRWVDTGIKPTKKEIASNPRARSAVLRVIEKTI
jgi:16S rRNA (cytosine1402-N4)-methyltransferase